MIPVTNQDVRGDELSTFSNVREVLRALYNYGPDYIMLRTDRGERLLHKEHLVSLLELGREAATIDDMTSDDVGEPLSARARIEDTPPDTLMLVFVQGDGPSGELSRMTFGEYRERGIRGDAASRRPPAWWGAPLPLMLVDGGRVSLNRRGAELMPCGEDELSKRAARMALDKMVTVKDKRRERTFSLQPLDERVFLIEDISGDFEMAEDLVWWAAVGKAFFGRLEENGAVIRRLPPMGEAPEDAAEIIPCLWEGEPVGSLAISFGGAEAPETQAAPQKRAGRRGRAAPEPPVSGEPEQIKPGGSKPEEGEEPKRKTRARAERGAGKPRLSAKPDDPAKSLGRRRAARKPEANAAPLASGDQPARDAEAEFFMESAGGRPYPEDPSGLPSCGEGSPAYSGAEEYGDGGDLLRPDPVDSPDGAGGLTRLNKNAARKAYGGSPPRRPQRSDGKQAGG
jgi:hypothetical protein